MDDSVLSFEGHGMRLDTAEQAEVICKELDSRQWKTLILEGNTFGIEAAERIGESLSKQPFLREARFKDIFTSRGKTEVPIAMNHLLTGISQSGTELTLLDLSDNAVGPTGAPAIFKFLATPCAKKITKLYLNNCGLGPEGSSLIAVPISELHLKEFICGRNRLENKGASFMFAALREMVSLEVLKMPQNGIYVEGIAYLVQAIMRNIKTIRVIDLSDNTLKAKGAEALERVIMSAKNLQELRLDDALLGNEGFSIICDAISRSEYAKNVLTHASFEGNEIHGHKIIDLIDLTFSECHGDFTLNLLDNEFTKPDLTSLASLSDKFNMIIDDPEDMDEETDDDDADDDDNYAPNGRYADEAGDDDDNDSEDK